MLEAFRGRKWFDDGKAGDGGGYTEAVNGRDSVGAIAVGSDSASVGE